MARGVTVWNALSMPLRRVMIPAEPLGRALGAHRVALRGALTGGSPASPPISRASAAGETTVSPSGNRLVSEVSLEETGAVSNAEIPAGCLLVTGVPGAGKTTVTHAVAERLPRAARLDGDVFGLMLVSGRADMVDQAGRWNPGPEGKRQLQLRTVNVCSAADNFADAGFLPVIDHVVETREELAFIAERLRTRPLLLVVLCPPLAVARRRNATRPAAARVDYDFAPLAANQRRELGDLGWWLDSGELSAEETADLIVAEAAQRAVVAAGRLRP